MLLGCKNTFAINIEWSDKINLKYLRFEDQVTCADIMIFINNINITENNKNPYITIGAYSFARWINDNYLEIFEEDSIPLNIGLNYSNVYELVVHLEEYIKNAKDRGNHTLEIQKWLNTHTINKSPNICLPTLIFVLIDKNINEMGLVYKPCIKNEIIFMKQGFEYCSIEEIKLVLKYFVLATAIQLRNDKMFSNSKKLLTNRWNIC